MTMIQKLFYCVIAIFFVAPMSNANTKSHYLKSPDGSIELRVSPTYPVRYSLLVAGQLIVNESQAALMLDEDKRPINSVQVINVSNRSVDRVLTPHVKQKSKYINEKYNEITLHYNNKQSIDFRLFDNGFAYRFRSHLQAEHTVNSELATFDFFESTQVLFPEEKSFISHNERLYIAKGIRDIEEENFASLPLLVEFKDLKIVLTETGLKDYPGMWLRGNSDDSLVGIFPRQVLETKAKDKSDRNEVITKRASYLSRSFLDKTQKTRKFPWRVLAIAKEDGDLLTNELSYLLADELAIDPSWVKPGQVAWDWWNANNVYDVDFTAGINTETYKHYIDFAAKYGLEYIVMDEGWHHLDSVLNVVDEIDVKEIIAYGKSKNVDVILWVIWKTLDQQLDKALESFAGWGAAGIKVDFMQRDDQAMVNYYWKIAREAAKRKLLVDFHGSYKPAGLRRAYPNVITREGVRGLEHNKWADYISSEHNLTLPFIRQLAGPMDYTPGAMINAQPENFAINFNRPMSRTTRAHQVSMYVIFESPLQMLADSPSNYLRESQSTHFISEIPTVWDETKVLSAQLSDHIVLARRYQNEWFIAVMGNSKAREFNIDFSFLPKEREGYTFMLESFEDGVNAHRYASDYIVKTKRITRHSKVKVKLAPNGGWVGKIILPK